MKRYLRFLTGSLVFRVFAPIVVFSVIFTLLGAKLLYDTSLKELTLRNKTSVESEVRRVFYITESKFTTLFLTYGSDPDMYSALTPSIKQEVLTELDKFADYNQYCYAILSKNHTELDSCAETSIVSSILQGTPIKVKGISSATMQFLPWDWNIVVYTKSSIFEKTVKQNITVIVLSIGAFTAAILLFFLLVFYVLVRRPFNIILNQLKKIEKQEYSELNLYSSREMHQLVIGLNQLSNAVQSRTSELLESNRVLNDRVKEETDKNMESARIIYEHQRHQALNSMLMNIAHHWRQPLNVIALMFQDIEDEVENETLTKEYMRSTSEQALKELKGMSNTIAKFTKLYENTENIEHINLHDQCLHAVEYIRNILLNIEPLFDINVPADITLYACEQDILELFMRLLDNIVNAVKTNELKNVKIRISAASLDDGTLIVIEDNAGGIQPELLKSIFEPYTTSSFKQKQKGLGLYLIRRMLEEKYNGTIQAENISNGTRITVFIKNIL